MGLQAEIEAEQRAINLAAKEAELQRLKEQAAAKAAEEEAKRKAEERAKAELALQQFRETAAAEEAKIQKEIEEKTKALEKLRNMMRNVDTPCAVEETPNELRSPSPSGEDIS